MGTGITVVPDEVNGLRLGVEALGVLVLDAIAIRKLHVFYLSFADVQDRSGRVGCARDCIPLVFFEHDSMIRWWVVHPAPDFCSILSTRKLTPHPPLGCSVKRPRQAGSPRFFRRSVF